MPPASSPHDSFRALQWNAGGLRARSTELLYFLSSHLVDLICIQESNLNSSFSFRIPGFSALRSDRTHYRSGILSHDATHASGGVIIFVRQGLSFFELSTFSLSLLDTNSDYVWVNISLNNFSSLSFLNVYSPPIRSSPMDGKTDSFSSSIFPYSRNLFFLGDFNCNHPLWESRGTSEPRGKYSTGSSLLNSSPSVTLTYLPFSMASLTVAPLLTFPLIPPLLLFPAPGRCYRTWVLITYQFFICLSSLSGLSPQRASPFLQFSESSLKWLWLLLLLSLSFCRGILVLFSFLCCCSLHFSGTECGQIFHSFRLHPTPS